MRSKILFLNLAIIAATLTGRFSAHAQGTAFTYQGRLIDSGTPATGNYDLAFSLYATNAGGSAILSQTNPAVPVTNGLFITSLNFGNIFTGSNYWLQIALRTNGSLGAFTTLSNRQALTPSPYALFAPLSGNVTGVLASSNLPATVAFLNGNQIFSGAGQYTNPANSFAGNGGGLTNVPFSGLNSGGAIAWAGTFQLASSPVVGMLPAFTAAGNFNIDGHTDLVCANYTDCTLIVLTNDGNGGFAPFSTNLLSPTAGPLCVAVADVNGDGSLDLISANAYNSTVTILTNNGSGGFALATNLGSVSAPFYVIATDINGDGKPDIICANEGNNTLTVFTNNGKGVFAVASSPPVGPEPVSVAAADINGDGKPDLIAANYNSTTLTVLTNKGGGQFATLSSPTVGLNPHSVTTADVNGDGKIDLICVDYGDDTLFVLTNNGSGGFVASSTNIVGGFPISVIATNLNGDAFVDLVCANSGTSTLTVLTNNGTGGFTIASSPAVGNTPHSVMAADLNGDGKVDLVTANSGTNTMSVLFNVAAINGNLVTVNGGLVVNTNVLFIPANGTNVGIDNSNPAYPLDVKGNINASGAYLNVSDARYKTNIVTLAHALEKVMALRGVEYDWRIAEYPDMKFDAGTQLGFIAQEIKDVLPEAVTQDAQGRYSVAYSKVIPVLVEALKEEEQNTARALQEKDARIDALEKRLGEVEKAVSTQK